MSIDKNFAEELLAALRALHQQRTVSKVLVGVAASWFAVQMTTMFTENRINPVISILVSLLILGMAAVSVTISTRAARKIARMRDELEKLNAEHL